MDDSNRRSITLRQIEDVSRRIADEFHPERVLLFGSYAWGVPSEDSDVDLLVILPFDGKAVAKSVEMRLKIRPPFPVDLLVRTPEKIRERLALGDPFIRSILEEGKVLYEAPITLEESLPTENRRSMLAGVAASSAALPVRLWACS